MFPVERSTILNDFTREINGQPVADHDGFILKLLNDDTVLKLAESALTKAWGKFMAFGTFRTGVIAILL